MKATALYLFLPLFLLALASLLTGCGSSEPSGTSTSADEAGQTDTAPPPPSGSTAPTILVLGNSLAAGYGLDDPDQAFPGLIQQKIDSLGWDFRVVNAGVSGETTAGGLSRIDWLLRQEVDVLILELGGNDGLRGIATEATRENLQAIIDRTRDRYPDVQVILAGMQIPPNLGQAYTTRFRDLYPALAEAADVHLIPFLLEGVGGVRRLNQGDGIHPTAEGQRIVAENVWKTLKPVLESIRREEPTPAG
ncbi:MAG: arylesterase [Rhodothermales bacterium]